MPLKKRLQKNIGNIIIIKHLQMTQISALSNP